MKAIKKIFAVVLVLMSVMALAIPAMAGTSSVTKGKSKYKSYDIDSSPSYDISVSGTKGDVLTVTLSLNDLEKPNADGTPNWKKSNSIKLTIGTKNSCTISPGSLFGFVNGRSNRARLTFTASSSNKGTISVTYPD